MPFESLENLASKLYRVALGASFFTALGVLHFGAISILPAAAWTAEPVVVYNKPLKLDFIADNYLCGIDAEGKRICIGDVPKHMQVGDTVSKFQSFIAVAGNFCARDERGVRCWETRGKYEKPIQQILAAGNAEKVRSGSDRVCLPQADSTIQCFPAEVGRWTPSGSGSVLEYVQPPTESYGPFADLRDFHLFANDICVLDGDSITCLPFINKDPASTTATKAREVYPDGPFPGARGIAGSSSALCVLSDAGLECALGSEPEEKSIAKFGEKWKTAKNLVPFGHQAFCAAAQSGEPVCIGFNYENKAEDAVPADLKAEGVIVEKFDIHYDRLCAITRQSDSGKKSFSCLSFSFGANERKGVPRAADGSLDIVEFKVASDGICVVDSKGLVHCFSGNYHQKSPLPEDGSEVQTSGYCQWNKSRFHCGNVDVDQNFSDIKKVLQTSRSYSQDHPCVIFENEKGTRLLRCFGLNDQLNEQAPILSPETTKLATTVGGACLYGGDVVSCWGRRIGKDLPSISSVKKVAFGSDFGCAVDQFGFVCWGDRLAERGLNVPSNLADIGFIEDFAAGNEHVCAITREARIECWGQNSEGQANAPMLSNPTSIAASERTTCASSDQGVTCWGQLQGPFARK